MDAVPCELLIFETSNGRGLHYDSEGQFDLRFGTLFGGEGRAGIGRDFALSEDADLDGYIWHVKSCFSSY